MNKGGGLQSLTGFFQCHLLDGKKSKFLIDQWKQFIGSFSITLFNSIQNTCDIGHDSSRFWTSQQKYYYCTEKQPITQIFYIPLAQIFLILMSRNNRWLLMVLTSKPTP